MPLGTQQVPKRVQQYCKENLFYTATEAEPVLYGRRLLKAGAVPCVRLTKADGRTGMSVSGTR